MVLQFQALFFKKHLKKIKKKYKIKQFLVITPVSFLQDFYIPVVMLTIAFCHIYIFAFVF